MGNPLSVAEIEQYLDVLKSVGAEKVGIAPVGGHPNFALVGKRWLDAIHAKGMKAICRFSHQNMEGTYGQGKYVGPSRQPIQFWIDKSGDMIRELGTSIQSGDEWAVYPERTEGIFQDATSWIWPNTPDNYANAFISIHEGMRSILPAGVILGMSANNASELLSGWMPKSLSDKYGVVAIDHYVDGDFIKLEADIRKIAQNYGKKVYLQEGAPHRFIAPTDQQARAYFDVLKRLDADGILYGFNFWGGWQGTPESLLTKTNGVWALNSQGEALKAWWTSTPAPVPTPPTEIILTTSQLIKLYQAIFHRPADTPGLDNWKGSTLDQFLDGVLRSEENAMYEKVYDVIKEIENWAREKTN